MAGLASNPEVLLKSLLLAVCLINMPAVRAGSDSTGGLKHSPETTWQNQGRQVTASHVEVGEQDATQRQEASPPPPRALHLRHPTHFAREDLTLHTQGRGGPGPSKVD